MRVSSRQNITGVGVVASLVEASGERVTVTLDWFADLATGKRVATAHGALNLSMERAGIGSIVRRHRGPGPPEGHLLGPSDFEDAAREMEGLLTLAEAKRNWVSTRAFLTGGGLTDYVRRRRRRWTNLRQVLASEGVPSDRKHLDAAPFRVEITPELRRELATD
jgi:hypothetical protein